MDHFQFVADPAYGPTSSRALFAQGIIDVLAPIENLVTVEASGNAWTFPIENSWQYLCRLSQLCNHCGYTYGIFLISGDRSVKITPSEMATVGSYKDRKLTLANGDVLFLWPLSGPVERNH